MISTKYIGMDVPSASRVVLRAAPTQVSNWNRPVLTSCGHQRRRNCYRPPGAIVSCCRKSESRRSDKIKIFGSRFHGVISFQQMWNC
jgi:hypothetical protein